jgi:hypothetical protein
MKRAIRPFIASESAKVLSAWQISNNTATLRMHRPKTAASALTITQRAANILIPRDAGGVCDGFRCRELFFVIVGSQSGGGCRGKGREAQKFCEDQF